MTCKSPIIDDSWNKKSTEHKELYWKKIGEDKKDSYPFFHILTEKHENPRNQYQHDFRRIEINNWVGVFAVTPDFYLVTIEQYRIGTKEITLEMPGGVSKVGEDFKLCAERELEEETGHVGKNYLYLGSLATNPAILTNQITFYACFDAEKTKSTQMDLSEDIRTKYISIRHFDNLITKGEVNHALVVGGFHLFKNIALPVLKKRGFKEE